MEITKEQVKAMKKYWQDYDWTIKQKKRPRRMTWFILGMYFGLAYIGLVVFLLRQAKLLSF